MCSAMLGFVHANTALIVSALRNRNANGQHQRLVEVVGKGSAFGLHLPVVAVVVVVDVQQQAAEEEEML